MAPKSSKRRPHRPEVDLRRKRAREEEHGREAEATKAQAEERSLRLAQAFKTHRRNQIIGWSLLPLSAAIIVTHLLEHAGTLRFFSPSLEDLLIGFPTAGVLLIISVLYLGQLNPSDKA